MSDEQTEQEDKPQLARTLAGSLWFPLLFFFGFLFCYMLPFHSPSPHDVKVAVSGPVAAAQLSAGLDQQAPGAFDIMPVNDAAAAKDKVTGRDAVAAYSVEGKKAVLYVAKADGTYLEQAATTTFTGIAKQGGQKLTIVEVAPTAKGDLTGTGLFYMAMVWNIVPYISVMMLMRAVTVSRRVKLLTLAGIGAFTSVVGYLVGLSMDIVPNQPLAILYAFMITQAVAWVTYGLVPFVRQFIPGVAITLFVLLSIPSSGGAIPYQLVPGFFRALHPVMPLGNLIDALHGIFYFGKQDLLRPTLVLCAWLAAGAALIGAGFLLERRKAAHAGETPSAIAEVQIEEPVEDPTFEAPAPHAADPDRHQRFGGQPPMLVGAVRTSDGTPVAQAGVTILGPNGHQLLRTVTDHEGRYAATGLPQDFVTVLLLTNDYTPGVARLLLTDGHTFRQDFVLDGRVHRPIHA
ncbi:carboxypeptidase regulatory-like domain-containing protein [Actinomadura sp. NPDC048394]|uniref:carboxypeptidase regulatory-like domain-containing protein n=1 Tax=Actinomadura sp. NPDC048394 TaxID=3158223 RepID=UPI0033C8AB09